MVMNYQTGETTRLRRQRIEQAIQLALESRWKEAVAVNRSLIAMFPSDVDAYNRLGKALMEMGEYDDARMAYERALELEPLNTIARKNLERLEVRAKAAAAQGNGTRKIDPALFIAETGKTGIASLRAVAPEVLGRLTAGDTLELRPQDNTLAVTTSDADYVGQLEPKLGLRLLRLMNGGNRYVVAVASLSEQRVVIREIYQHPSQQGKPSFPAVGGGETVRPYVKDRLVRREMEEEEVATEEPEEGEEWESEAVATEGDMTLQDYQEATEGEDDAEEGFEE
jgi:tetratricopeptide (TPR) repeat protein